MKKILAILLMTVSVISFAQAGEHMAKKSEGKPCPRFEKMDTNKDGTISKEEFLKVSEERATKRFDKLDTNKDGQISKEEMQAGKKNMKGKMGKHEGMKKGEGKGKMIKKEAKPEVKE